MQDVVVGILEHQSIQKLERTRHIRGVWAAQEDLEADAPHGADVDVGAAQEEAVRAAGARVVAFEERAVEERDHRGRVHLAEGVWEGRLRGEAVGGEDRVVALGVAAAAGLGV